MTLKDLSLNAEFAWRPSSRFTFDGELHMHSFKGAENVYYNNNQPYTLAYGRPQLTARLRGEYRARKVSLEVEAQMQSVRHWTTYTSVNEKPSEPDSDSGLNLGRRVIGLYDFKVPSSPRGATSAMRSSTTGPITAITAWALPPA